MSKFLGKATIFFSVMLALIILASLPLSAAPLGKLAGTIKDAETGEALPGVNVLIVGTTMGATTDLDGRYFILNVPPGTFSVKATFMGYTAITQTEVKVQTGITTELNFSLKQTVLEGEAVTIVAARPLVEKSLTTSKTTMGAEELDNALPVASVHDIVETAASTFQGYIRGGRKYETKTLVDGVDVSDTYFSGGTGRFGTGDVGHYYQGFRRSEGNETTMGDVTASSVQEMNVMAGTFTAEFPTASAGIINMVTKSGADKYTGKIFVRGTPSNEIEHFGDNPYWMANSVGDYVGYLDRKTLLAESESIQNKRSAEIFTWTPELAKGDDYEYDPTDSTGLGRSYEVEGNFSGPIPGLGGKGGFFFSGRYSNMRTSAMPFDRQKTVTLTLKTHYDFSSDKRLTLYGQINDGGKLFNFVNWKFNPKWMYYMEGAPRYKDLGVMAYAKWTHTLSPKTFYEVQLSQANKTSWIGYPDDDGDGYCDIDESGDFIEFSDLNEYFKYLGGQTRIVEDDNGNQYTTIDWTTVDGYVGNWRQQEENANTVLPARDPNRTFFYSTIDPASGYNEAKVSFGNQTGTFRPAYPAPLYSKTKRNVTTLKADLTSQISFNHQIKTGAQFRMHDIEVNHLQSELGGAGLLYPMSAFHVDNESFKPKEVAFYLQDRIEYGGMIVNVGARVDGYNNDTENFVNEFNPYSRVEFAGSLLEFVPNRGDKVGYKWFVSPRLGVSHPVSDRMAMHYSFGKFVQYPNFSTLYTDYNFSNYSASPAMTSVYVNQEPMKSTSYEIGLQWTPLADIAMDAVVYYRDVENYGNRLFTINPSAGKSSQIYTTWGHADSRGIELTLEKRRSAWWSGRVSYSYAYIKQAVNGSGNENLPDTFSSADSAVYGNQMPWDMLYRYEYREENVTITSTTGNALAGGFDRTHRFSGHMMFFIPYNFQLAAIGNAMSGFKYRQTEDVDNDPWFNVSHPIKEGPWNYWLNLKLSWEGKLGGIRFQPFVEVRNVTNKENILAFDRNGFDAVLNEKMYQVGRDGLPNTGDEQDPQGVNKMPFDAFGRMLYGEARMIWAGIELGF